LAVFQFIMLGYSITQMMQLKNNSDKLPTGLEIFSTYSEIATTIGFLIAIIVLMAIFAMAFFALAFKLFREFGWVIYKKIGADLTIRRLYRNYQILLMILKFDGFLLFAFSSQWLLFLVSEGNTRQAILHGFITILGFPLMLAIVFWAVKTERRWAMWVFFLANLGNFCYFVARLILLFPPYSSPGILCDPDDTREVRPDCDRFIAHRNFLTLFLTTNMLMGMITLGIAIKAYKNFDKGLRRHLTSSSSKMEAISLKKRRTVID